MHCNACQGGIYDALAPEVCERRDRLHVCPTLLLLLPPVCLPQVLAPIQTARLILAAAPNWVDTVYVCGWLCAADHDAAACTSAESGTGASAGTTHGSGGMDGQEEGMPLEGGTAAPRVETLAAAGSFLHSCWAEEDPEGAGFAPEICPSDGSGDGACGGAGDAGHLLASHP